MQFRLPAAAFHHHEARVGHVPRTTLGPAVPWSAPCSLSLTWAAAGIAAHPLAQDSAPLYRRCMHFEPSLCL